MVKTIKLQGKDYAQVADRIKEFRTACPNGLMETAYTFMEGGQVIWKARILKDKENDKNNSGNAQTLPSILLRNKLPRIHYCIGLKN